jgi:hypothetical protein
MSDMAARAREQGDAQVTQAGWLAGWLAGLTLTRGATGGIYFLLQVAQKCCKSRESLIGKFFTKPQIGSSGPRPPRLLRVTEPQFGVSAIDLKGERLDWESICYKDDDVRVWRPGRVYFLAEAAVERRTFSIRILKKLAVGYCLLGIGCWVLPVGYCLLGVACWVLPVGHCLLDISCWILPVACCL